MNDNRRMRSPLPGAAQALPVISVTTHGVALKASDIPKVSSSWTLSDHVGHWKVRWGIGRMNYRVEPGLYALGSPGSRSPVVVTANYRLTFDVLRRAIAGHDVWILALDTRGVNVWCAAGKGTFGTDELVRRIAFTELGKIVSHRRLILPQLGGPGIAAHEVKKRSGFGVLYGPVRAEDLPRFLAAGLKADDGMRRVTFTTAERLVLVPMELVPALRGSVPLLIILWLLGGWGWWGYSMDAFRTNALNLTTAYLGALATGVFFTPLLLPWLPGRAFSVKGTLAGLIWALLFIFLISRSAPGSFPSRAWEGAVWLLALPSISAFLAMNFTGSSTITSLSGVKKEFRYAVPLQMAGVGAGLILWFAGHFLQGSL